jgi:hypothetical protein
MDLFGEPIPEATAFTEILNLERCGRAHSTSRIAIA